MRLLFFAFIPISISAATSISGTICGGVTGQVTYAQYSSSGVLIASVGPTTYTGGALSTTLANGTDGSYWRVTVQCPSSTVTTKWLIPDIGGTLTIAQVTVPENVSLGNGWYWDTKGSAWANTATGINSNGGMPLPSGNGIAVNNNGTAIARTIIATAGGGVSIINGDGVSGNPSTGVDPLTIPRYSIGSGAPSLNCTPGGDWYFRTDDSSTYYCAASPNIWVRTLSANTVVSVAQGGTGANLSATGGPGQYLKQLVTGGPVSVATILPADYPTMIGDSGAGGTKGAVPPPGVGDATKCLSGAATYITCAGSPGGATTQVQFNDAGTFGGSANYTWNKVTQTLSHTATLSNSGYVISQPASSTASAFQCLNASNYGSSGGFCLQFGSSAIASGNSNGQLWGGNMATGYTGDVGRVQVNGANRVILGLGTLILSASSGATNHFSLQVNGAARATFNSSILTGGAFSNMNGEATNAGSNVNTGIQYFIGGSRLTARSGSVSATNLVATTAANYSGLVVQGNIYMTAADSACTYTPKINFTYNGGSRQVSPLMGSVTGAPIASLTNPAANDMATFSVSLPHTGTGAVTYQIDAVGTCSTGVYDVAITLAKAQQ